jgi:hypothetical protein
MFVPGSPRLFSLSHTDHTPSHPQFFFIPLARVHPPRASTSAFQRSTSKMPPARRTAAAAAPAAPAPPAVPLDAPQYALLKKRRLPIVPTH